MRKFTDAEKRQLQAKINDQQERHNQAVREIARRRDGKKRESPTFKYGYLVFIILLLTFSVYILLKGELSVFHRYSAVILVLWFLIDHIADYFTKTGWQRRVMVTAARIWSVFALAYGVWILSGVSIPLMAGYVVLVIIFFVLWPGSFWRKIFGKYSRYNLVDGNR